MTGLVFAFWFGALLCGASVVTVVLTMPIDKAFDMKLEKLRKPLLEDSEVSVNPILKWNNDDSAVSASRQGMSHHMLALPLYSNSGSSHTVDVFVERGSH